jgi:hypothetical protein
MLEKDKRWIEKDYTRWVATLPCVNCGLHDETIVAHHLKHRHAPHGGGGMGLKAHDFFTMPLCFECHASAHAGDANVLDFQADFIFKTLTKAFRYGILAYKPKLLMSKDEQRQWRNKNLYGEQLDD